MTSSAPLVLALLVLSSFAAMGAALPRELPALRVSDNSRYLVTERGEPFFYLGDTAWELFHRLDREDAQRYLEDRAAKGFTVIQAVVLAEHDGLRQPNAYGDLPLVGDDPTRPNEAYFEHVDAVVDMAQRLGLHMGMLPTWGDKWNLKWGVGPEVFSPENAEAYGEFLGARYRNKPIIWILGGDRNPESDLHLAIVRAMARGLRRGDGGRHLITYHPTGGSGSSQWFHEDDWLDFNMIQSGHGGRNIPNYRMIGADYDRTPVKPCMDGEPCYENLPVGFDPANGWFGDHDARKAAYWAVFAGAHGHTYGCNDIWQMYAPPRPPVIHARTPWQEAMSLPGAAQMQHLRALMESRPFLTRIPDQSLIVPETSRQPELTHLVYSRATDGRAAVYVDGRQQATRAVAGALDNWDSGFRLALANELTEDRAWLGEYHLVAIYDRALSAEEVETRFHAGPAARPKRPLVLYTFADGAGDTVPDVSETGDPINLEISDVSAVEWIEGRGLAVRSPVVIASRGPASGVAAAITKSGAISIEAWVKPATYAQTGPARIVTLSHDPTRRNFTLGQQADAYEVRLRTTNTSENGLPGLATTGSESRHVQATRDADGSYAMVYVPESSQTVTVNTRALSGGRLKAWWYDPRTGAASAHEGDFPAGGKLQFTTPEGGPDWVLVLDDAARGYPPPGLTAAPD